MKGTNGTSPPKLGDVTLLRKGDTEWAIQRAGVTVASGLAFAQVLQIVRGELDIAALQGERVKKQ